MDHDRRLRDELEHEPALGGANLQWGYDDVRDEPALGSGAADWTFLPQRSATSRPYVGRSLTHGRRIGYLWHPLPSSPRGGLGTSQGLMLGLIATAMVPLPLVGLIILQISGAPFFRAIAATVLLPLVLEILKPAVGLAVVEGRPWLIPDRASLISAHVIGGLGFGMMLYALVTLGPLLLGLSYSPIRLLVAMVLHAVTALVSGWGAAKVWHTTHTTGTAPALRQAIPYVAAAVALHAAYGVAVLIVADIDVGVLKPTHSSNRSSSKPVQA